MDIRQMKVLRAVIMTGSTSGAAQLLNVSQPAISKTIKLIEEEVQMSLFERNGRKLRPTPQAFTILPDIERTISSQEAMCQKIEEVRSGRRGVIKVATAAMVSVWLLPHAIVRYRRLYPNVDFALTTSTTKEVTQLVYENKVDIGICQRGDGYNSISSQTISSAMIVCAMPNAHPLARLSSVSAEDLMPYPVIMANFNEPILGARIAETFTRKGLHPLRTIECNISFSSIGLVSAGLGVALVDSYTVPIKGVTTRPYLPTIDLQIHTIYSNDQPLSPMVSAFCHTVSEVAAERHGRLFTG